MPGKKQSFFAKNRAACAALSGLCLCGADDAEIGVGGEAVDQGVECAEDQEAAQIDDDHQLQILEQFSKQGLLYACFDVDKLGEALEAVKSRQFRTYQSNNARWLDEISAYIDSVL